LRPIILAAILATLGLACAGDAADLPNDPRASEPALESGYRDLGSGVLDISLDPGQTRALDPLGMALNLGVTPPDCADFAMVFSWQILTPDPPGDARVAYIGERMGGRFEVGAPASSGEASIGCALLEAVNPSSIPLVVQMYIVIATSR
jgi:hypothetical protein